MKFFKPSGRLLALLMFLPITPSIAAITVFTQALLIDRNQNATFVPLNDKHLFGVSKNP